MASLTYDLTLAGLAVGSAAALTGIGLIVTYRATGVLNLAHGAVAMICAYLLRQLTVEWGWPLAPAAAFTLLVFAPALGLVLDRAVFRPLAGHAEHMASALVASLGVFVLLVGAASLLWGTGARADAPELLPADPWIQLSTAVALALAVSAVTRWTRFGRELRAVVDDRGLAVLSGIDAGRVSAAGWAFGTVTAGLTGVLLAPHLRLDPYGLPLLVMEVMAVAVAARMRSLPVAVGAALLVAVAQSQLARFHPEGWAQPLVQAVGSNLFAVALLAAALALPAVRTPATPDPVPPHTRAPPPVPATPTPPATPRPPGVPRVPAAPGETDGPAGPAAPGTAHAPSAFRASRAPTAFRTSGASGASGASGVHAVPLPLVAAILFLLPLGFAGSDLHTSVQVPALAVILLSLVVVTGRGGQISLGQAAYAGLGALLTAQLSPHLPNLLALAAAVLVVAPLGLLTGWPAIRRQGLALALTTLAISLTVSRFVLEQPYAVEGLVPDRPSGFDDDRAYYALELLLLAAAALSVWALRRGRYGRALAAIRDHEQGAAAAGVRVPALKLGAFVTGAALAALGGGLLTMGARAFDPGAFDPVRGLLWFAAIVVLGSDSVLGALLAAALLVGLDAGTQGGWAAAVIGVLAVARGRLPLPRALLARRPPTGGRVSRARAEGAVRPRAEKAVRPPLARRRTPARQHGPEDRGTLHVVGLTAAYGRRTVLEEVALDIPRARITALTGPNGAGKSTLFHCLAGTHRPVAGRVMLGDRDITRMPAHARTHLGIARTFQQPAVFPSLTVEDNVRVAAEHDPRQAVRALRLFELTDLAGAPAAGLPTAALRRLELARALATDPHTLLLDEPTAGLDPAETAALVRVLKALAADGMALLVIEHDRELVAELADSVHTLEARP
ncbi:ABC transporter permease subunit [Streptomyces iconiensis]|uniref:ATP-binding cassette domain-containing protein n=1 Tax=Streptomyces iconiensis TaxID=1384038 RepID=A0ABT7A5Z5_9ACTN|nr:ATP-binding cassette domain-containing protein [Streptomyces iconiensis]MDJ1136757.1 ATP-binding cassette domain-containing protein [Streptomyces iconiensis]